MITIHLSTVNMCRVIRSNVVNLLLLGLYIYNEAETTQAYLFSFKPGIKHFEILSAEAH
jgi:hypothetical protein